MPISSSAKKSLRVSLRKKKINDKRRATMRMVIKDIKKQVESGSTGVSEKLSTAYKAIDKAAKRGVIKKNTAARKKSYVARLANKSGK